MGPEVTDDNRPQNKDMKITVTRHGPYMVIGRVPLMVMEIRNDPEGHCRTWRKVREFPDQEQYSLCRCGQSKNKPFCDGTHTKIHFKGTESGDCEPYIKDADVIRGPALTLTDNTHLCGHVRFCMRAGWIWNLIRQSGNPKARDLAIEQPAIALQDGSWSMTTRPARPSNQNSGNPSLL